MRGRAQQPVLQVLAESVVDGERDDQRRHSGGDSGDGNAGDDANDRLAAFGAQVAGRDEEFEAHEEKLSALSRQLSARFDYSGGADRFGSEHRLLMQTSPITFLNTFAARRPARSAGTPGTLRRTAAPVPYLPSRIMIAPVISANTVSP